MREPSIQVGRRLRCQRVGRQSRATSGHRQSRGAVITWLAWLGSRVVVRQHIRVRRQPHIRQSLTATGLDRVLRGDLEEAIPAGHRGASSTRRSDDTRPRSRVRSRNGSTLPVKGPCSISLPESGGGTRKAMAVLDSRGRHQSHRPVGKFVSWSGVRCLAGLGGRHRRAAGISRTSTMTAPGSGLGTHSITKIAFAPYWISFSIPRWKLLAPGFANA
jgi:hypothetical protein